MEEHMEDSKPDSDKQEAPQPEPEDKKITRPPVGKTFGRRGTEKRG